MVGAGSQNISMLGSDLSSQLQTLIAQQKVLEYFVLPILVYVVAMLQSLDARKCFHCVVDVDAF